MVAIAASEGQSMALKEDGTIAVWGYTYGNFIPPGLREVVAIGARPDGAVVLKSDGTVVSWNASVDFPETPPELSGITAIASGGSYGNSWSLALRSDGTVVGWGRNNTGPLETPPGLNGVIDIAVHGDICAALKRDGSLVLWGKVPLASVQADATNAVALSPGFILNADGTLSPWLEPSTTPAPPELDHVIGAGGHPFHALAVVGPSNAAPVIPDAASWITEAAGARNSIPFFHRRILATGDPDIFAVTGLPPGLVLDAATGVVSGAATQPGTHPLTLSATNGSGTGNQAVVLTVTGEPRIFGPLPARVQASRDVVLNAVGTAFSATGLPEGLTIDPMSGVISGNAIAGNYRARIQASNGFGTVSADWFTEVPSVTLAGRFQFLQPVIPAGLTDAVAASSTPYRIAVLKSDGTVLSMGQDGSIAPVPPSQLSGVMALASGTWDTLALKADGTVVAWSGGGNPSAPPPADLRDVVSIAAGGEVSVAVRRDGSVVAWGDNSLGQTSLPAGLSGVKSVSTDGRRVLALKSDGTVRAWGQTEGGFLNVPAGLTGVVAVASGGHTSAALKSDGSVVEWGGFQPVAQPQGLGRVLAIAGGSDHLVAIQDGGKLETWGFGEYGRTFFPPNLRRVTAVEIGGAVSTLIIQAQPPARVTGTAGQDFLFNYPRRPQAVYSARGLPPGLTIHPDYGSISGRVAEAGLWTAEITVSNPEGMVTSGLPVFIESTAYAAWRRLYWPEPQESSAPDADPDGDGSSNLLEYVMGSHPRMANPPPGVKLSKDDGGPWTLTLEVLEARAALVDWTAQFAADLSFATPLEVSAVTEPGASAGWVRLRFAAPDLLPSPSRQFGRLKAVLR